MCADFTRAPAETSVTPRLSSTEDHVGPEHFAGLLRDGATGTRLLRAARAVELPNTQLPTARQGLIERAMARVQLQCARPADQDEGTKLAPETVRVIVHTTPAVRLEIRVPSELGDSNGFRRLALQHGPKFFGSLPRFFMLVVALADMILSNEGLFCECISNELGELPERLSFSASWGDVSRDRHAISYGRLGSRSNPLIPDVYFYQSDAYSNWKHLSRTDGKCWSDRRQQIVWRGATTGAHFSPENMFGNKRIKLVHICAEHPDLFDAKIYKVASQSIGPEVRAAADLLAAKGMLAKPMLPQAFRDYRYSIDIDGNSNAWGFFEKLSLGLCVLKVASPFEQWFYNDLKPWVHYVPVAGDLSDLVEVAREIRANSDAGERIADAAAAFAYEISVESASAKLCRDIAAWVSAERMPGA